MKRLKAWAIVVADETQTYHIYRTRREANAHVKDCVPVNTKNPEIVRVEIRECALTQKKR